MLACVFLTACGGGGGGTSLSSSDESPDPVVLDIPIAYIKRPVVVDDNGDIAVNNLADPIELFDGARLLIRPRSSNLAEEIDLTDRIIEIIVAEEGADPALLGLDIKDLESSFDGSTLVFAVRAIPDIENNNDPELFTWNLWTYRFDTDQIGYVIDSPLIRNEGAESGGGQDIAPHFLTDDRIVFSSSRQSAIQEKQLNEGRGQRYSAVSEVNGNAQAMALHIYDPGNGELAQISLSRNFDLDPATLESGEIIFSRLNSNRQYSLFQINPSGGQLSALYGSNSSDVIAAEESTEGNNESIQFLQPRELPDGRILTLIRPQNQSQPGGDIAIINTQGFVDILTTVLDYDGSDERGQVALSDIDINALDELSPGGKYLSAYPLKDGTGRVLVSWSPCRIENSEGLYIPCSIADSDDQIDDAFVAAPPLFGLWIFSPNDGTQLPVVLAEEGFIISEVVIAEPRSFPTTPDEEGVFDPVLAAENQGVIIIDSIYNLDDGVSPSAPLGIAAYSEPGTFAYAERPARFIRVIQPVPIPNDDVLDDLPNAGGRYDLLEILGYVPVEPDGSVTVKVPANTPVMLNILDENGRRISTRHDNWLQVAQGEILRCVGCHDSSSDIPHGRLDSQPASSNPGAIALSTGLEGFIGADPALFASELGQTMAEVYELRKPDDDDTKTVRDLQLELTYIDEWTDRSVHIPDPDIDLSYDSSWDIPEANAIIAPNLDPALQGRIVINYNDHIQPIWERERTITQDGLEVLGPNGTAVTNCIGCHSSDNDTRVPAGQLDLSSTIADGIFTRSYLELTRPDNEQWINSTGAVADRQRLCTELDDNGNELTVALSFNVSASVNRGSALASRNFFNCFEVNNTDQCGAFIQDLSVPPSNCTDDGGTVSENGALTTKVTPGTFAEAQALMAALDTPLSLTDDPQLMSVLRTHCASCHSVAGGEVPHSDSDDDIAYNELVNSINLVNPAASTFVIRLSVQNHQCGDAAACDALGVVMEEAISTFASAVPEETISNVVSGGSISTEETFNHFGLLTPSERRLMSEWLDIGSPFYNNPFDPRLFD
ncbi:hypothetical protein BST96_00900 [Oceanicoccus sagamiensis]|uniref:Cytochrome c domain-containing protein n=1 Tax=Oceanicoccus sagamiensis TaxID=716816 RepID=A0A1X9N8M7_9GAMM|nr:hypothetical protein BST96_00900 [Oceanicoccus sagamiensis]